MQFRTEDSPAPGDLIRLQGFLNTQSNELGIEDLGTVSAAETWLRAAGLWQHGRTLRAAEHSALLEWRALLRQWVASRQPPAAMQQQLNNLSFHLVADGEGQLHYEQANDGVSGVVATLIGAAVHAQNEGTWERLRCCSLESCGWCYYDSTRSRTRRWCSMQTCGSRAKSRAYYRRKTQNKPLA